ncbi:AraC family transcriptional regulator [Bordetella trematum]|nr:helix-turn-helix transcriptional regulator [Bordetella trematum]
MAHSLPCAMSFHAPDRSDLHHIDRPVVATGIAMVTGGEEAPPHRHHKAQVLYTLSGVITCETEAGMWLVPAGCAIWIPGGMRHRAGASDTVQGYVLFIEPDTVDGLPQGCTSLAVSPLLRALIEQSARLPKLYAHHGPAGRLMAVLLDELAAAPQEALHLPWPADDRLRRLTQAIIDDPAQPLTLAQWAPRIGMSERNLSRQFRQQTGMSLGRWRRQWHIIASLQRLTAGQTVQTVAFDLGYDSASAFVTMFKKAMGQPPMRFLAQRPQAA